MSRKAKESRWPKSVVSSLGLPPPLPPLEPSLKSSGDATNDNKKWAMDIAIKSLPTFRLYKGGEEQHCGQVTGTKVAALKELISEELSKLN